MLNDKVNKNCYHGFIENQLLRQICRYLEGFSSFSSDCLVQVVFKLFENELSEKAIPKKSVTKCFT